MLSKISFEPDKNKIKTTQEATTPVRNNTREKELLTSYKLSNISLYSIIIIKVLFVHALLWKSCPLFYEDLHLISTARLAVDQAAGPTTD